MKRSWRSQGHYMPEKREKAGCHWWRTLQLNVIHTNVCRETMDSTMSYLTTCEAHLHTHSLHHLPGISVSYLSKHTHSCVACPSDGILKKVNLWRVLSVTKIIHFDESVHIFKVSSLKPFGGMTFTLIWNRCFINHLSLQTLLCFTTHQPELKTCWEWQHDVL